MLGETQEGQDPYLSVLQEIKQLMDERLGGKLSPEPKAEVEIEVKPEGVGEIEPKDEGAMGLADDEMETLKKIRAGM